MFFLKRGKAHRVAIYPIDTSSSVLYQFNMEVSRRKSIDISSIMKDEPCRKDYINLTRMFDVDLTFKIDKISTSSPSGFSDVFSMSNRCNF